MAEIGKLVNVLVYLDDTPLKGNPKFDNGNDNIWEFNVTEETVRKWYELHEEEFIKEQIWWHQAFTCDEITEDECSFEHWFYETYVLDDMDGFYDFCFR